MAMMHRHGNTATEMTESGEWSKVGRKHYRHVSGVEVRYDVNAWGWRVDGGSEVWDRLYVAKAEAEKVAEAERVEDYFAGYEVR